MVQAAQASPVSFERITSGRHVINQDAARAEFGDKAVDEFLTSLTYGDDLAYAVIEDFAKLKARGWQMVDEALAHGIDSVPDAPLSLVAFFREVEHVPEWVDWEQLYRGAVAYWRAGAITSFVLTVGALGGSLKYRATRPLVFTGRLEEKAPTRARETSRWLITATRPGAMRKGEGGFNMSVHLRLIHSAVTRACMKSPKWNWDDWGFPICNADNMFAIGYVFSTAIINPLARSGIRYSKQERADIYALFRYIGYVLGVPAHLNPVDEADAMRRNALYAKMTPGPDVSCRMMLKGLLDTVTGEGKEKVESLPKWITILFPPTRLRMLLYGMFRYWNGDASADEFLIPQTRWKYALTFVKPLLIAKEFARKIFGANDEKDCLNTLAYLENALRKPGESDLVPVEDIKPTAAYS